MESRVTRTGTSFPIWDEGIPKGVLTCCDPASSVVSLNLWAIYTLIAIACFEIQGLFFFFVALLKFYTA